MGHFAAAPCAAAAGAQAAPRGDGARAVECGEGAHDRGDAHEASPARRAVTAVARAAAPKRKHGAHAAPTVWERPSATQTREGPRQCHTSRALARSQRRCRPQRVRQPSIELPAISACCAARARAQWRRCVLRRHSDAPPWRAAPMRVRSRAASAPSLGSRSGFQHVHHRLEGGGGAGEGGVAREERRAAPARRRRWWPSS